MNLPTNLSLAGLTSAISPSSGSINGLTQSHQSGNTLLPEQDWFSAQSLSNGQTIEANRFESPPGNLSVEQATDKILSRLFPGE